MKRGTRNARLLSWIYAASVVLGVSDGHAQTAGAFRLEAPPADALPSRFSEPEIALLEKLNRADREHLPQLPQLVVPERWLEDERAYSPLPRRYEAGAPLRKLLVVHLPGQLFGAYEFGELVRWGPISSGAAATATPPGRYHLNWRATGHVSSVNPEWFMPWYFNYDNEQGRAFHEYELPGRPASHGCLRLLRRDAQWLFDWGEPWRLDAREVTVMEPGTPVLIVGEYGFAAAPPWRGLAWLAQPVALPRSVSGD